MTFAESERAYNKKFGERLRAIRKTLGVSENEMAEAAGVTIEMYRKLEKGAVAALIGPVENIAYAFDISFKWLGSGKGNFFNPDDYYLWDLLPREERRPKGVLTDSGRVYLAGAIVRH
jgi:transcriptional regulator with XRE-family HTH domain